MQPFRPHRRPEHGATAAPLAAAYQLVLVQRSQITSLVTIVTTAHRKAPDMLEPALKLLDQLMATDTDHDWMSIERQLLERLLQLLQHSYAIFPQRPLKSAIVFLSRQLEG